MKKIILAFALATVLSFAFSQKSENYNALGYHIDINKELIHGYIDKDYSPVNKLKLTFIVGGEYTLGCYYDKSGKKNEGFIKYSQNNSYFSFKKNITDKKAKTIRPSDCSGYKIGVDSFAVIKNFKVERDLASFPSEKEEFAEVITEYNNLVFFKHIRVGLQNEVITFLCKQKGSNELVSFPKQHVNFKEVAKKIFKGSDLINSDIESKVFKTSNIIDLIKSYNYFTALKENRKIYFNSSWDEVSKAKNHSYFAKIVLMEGGSEFRMKYFFKDGSPIYEEAFNTIDPSKKKDDRIFYFPNGNLRKIIDYRKKGKVNYTTYHTNGNIHRKYSSVLDANYYYTVIDNNGNNILNDKGDGKENFYDSITKKQITYEYEKHRLTAAYYINVKGMKVYQLCKINTALKFQAKTQAKFKKLVNYPDETIKESKHGYVLLKCIVEPSGLCSNIEIIQSIDANCDSELLEFITYLITKNVFFVGKHNKEKVMQEVILPIKYELKGFTRQRYNNNYMMHHQHMMNHNIPPPSYNFK